MKYKNNGKRHNDDFHKMVVDLDYTGHSVRDLSSEYGVPKVTIYVWIKKFTPVELEDDSSITPDHYNELQRQCISYKRITNLKKGYGYILRKVYDTEIKDLLTKKRKSRNSNNV